MHKTHQDVPFESGDLALDFLNTRGTGPRGADRLSTIEDLLSWAAEAGVGSAYSLVGLRASPPEARLLLTEAHRLRSEIGRLVEAYATGSPLPSPAVHVVNRVLDRSRIAYRLTASPAGEATLVDREASSSPMAALSPVALAAARLVTTADPARLRGCAAVDCPLWFLDTSKNGRRRWCSMARCGNRAKAATHYRKVKTTGEGATPVAEAARTVGGRDVRRN